MNAQEAVEYLYSDESLPPAIRDNLEIVVEEDGEPTTINLGKVLNTLKMLDYKPVPVMTYLLKVKQGICNLAYSAEEYHARTEDAFRVWRAEEGRILNLQDDRNPLVKEGAKTTNAAIDAYIRSQPEYEEFKNKLAEIESFKNILWTAKKTIESAIEVGKLVLGSEVVEEMDADEFDARLAEIAEDLLS